MLSNCYLGLSSENLTATDFEVFPNPAQNQFTIKTTQQVSDTIEVTNLMGQLIFKTSIKENVIIKTSNWESGLYIVKYNNSTKKIIINH
jgi:hypothetical protein